VWPNSRLKVVVNEPTLWNPTLKQMSATDQSVACSNAAPRSSRLVNKY
jgi:hypothetical protein